MGSGNDPCWTQAEHKTCFQNLVIFISVNFSVLFRFVMFILLYYIFKYSKISIYFITSKHILPVFVNQHYFPVNEMDPCEYFHVAL